MDQLLHISARTPDGVQQLAYSEDGLKPADKVQTLRVEYSADGRTAAHVSAEGVALHHPGGVTKVSEPGIVLSGFSRAGAFFVTCVRPSKDAASGQGAKNLKVWDVASGACMLAVSQKQVNKDAWPAVQFTADDARAMHMVTNTLHVYSRADGFGAPRRVPVKGVGAFALSPTPTSTHVAVFVPEVKGSPASAAVVDYGGEGGEPVPLVRKAFFRCQGAQMMWNATGSACLVLAFADFDVTNQSYYGEQKLYYLPTDPARADSAQAVPLPKEGPVHDVQWSPAGDYFLTVAGFMPAKMTLFDALCKPVFDLGNGPYSIARWNPFGRFFIIAGFGNLPGDIIFYDKKASGTCRQMGAVRCPSVTAEWSPDGRSLLTTTTAPRMRVDNALRVFTYYGQLKAHQAYETLLDATWKPAPEGTFSDRPQSPERIAAATGAASPSGAGSAKSAGPVGAARPVGYVPPHLRRAGGGSAPAAAQFSLAHDPNDKGGRIKAGAVPQAGVPFVIQRSAQQVPGAEFINPKAAGKSARKRGNKGGKEGAGGDEGGGDGAGPAVDAAAADVASLSVQDGGAGAEDPAKRVRNLQKKLRQIQQLKEKMAGEGAGALEAEQLAKVSAEASVIAELQALGAPLA